MVVTLRISVKSWFTANPSTTISNSRFGVESKVTKKSSGRGRDDHQQKVVTVVSGLVKNAKIILPLRDRPNHCTCKTRLVAATIEWRPPTQDLESKPAGNCEWSQMESDALRGEVVIAPNLKQLNELLERETGLEPATSSLGN